MKHKIILTVAFALTAVLGPATASAFSPSDCPSDLLIREPSACYYPIVEVRQQVNGENFTFKESVPGEKGLVTISYKDYQGNDFNQSEERGWAEFNLSNAYKDYKNLFATSTDPVDYAVNFVAPNGLTLATTTGDCVGTVHGGEIKYCKAYYDRLPEPTATTTAATPAITPVGGEAPSSAAIVLPVAPLVVNATSTEEAALIQSLQQQIIALLQQLMALLAKQLSLAQ